MGTGSRGVSSLLIVLIGGLLCVGTYFLGLKHGSARAEGSTADRRAVADIESLDRSETAVAGGRSLPVDAEMPKQSSAEIASATRRLEEIEAEQRQRLMRNIESNLELPGMSRIIREQQRVLMADQYRSLIETLGLNEKEKAYFLDLLTARQMYRVDMGMNLMTGMLSEAERNELMERVGAGIDSMDEEIDRFLNNETDSEYFDHYERTETERAVVDAVRSQLSQAGNPLAEGMDRELVAIMHEEISAYPFSVEFEENGEPAFSNFTSENIDLFLREMQNLRAPMMQKAAEVLDSQQLEVFAGSFDQYAAFYEQRLRMVQGLFNPTR